ncbi:MAG: hypothetical protein J2P30_01625 [Actinobacteria bacterium]|nr:hypothetical protein [Actinomycetota bacterium]
MRAPHPGLILAAVTAATALCLATAGCASFDRALGRREAVVQFQSNTPTAEMLKVRAACSHLAAAKPEPIPRHVPKIDLPDAVRYEVSQASDAQIARLTQCLDRFPSVTGIELTSPSGD